MDTRGRNHRNYASISIISQAFARSYHKQNTVFFCTIQVSERGHRDEEGNRLYGEQVSEPIKPSLNDKEPWNEGGSVNFSAEDRRRRQSVVTGESEEVRARLRAKRRNTDDDALTDRKHNDEDEDENVEIIGECRRWNYLSL